MTTVLHPLVKRFLDGELRLADLPPELHAEARAAERLLGAVDRAPVTLPAALEARVMAEVRQRVIAPSARRWWHRLAEPWEIRLRLRPWILGPALAAAAVLVLILARSQPPVPPVAVAAAPESVYVRFVLYAPGAHRVSVAGTFNQWDATTAPLAPAGAAGVWARPVAAVQAVFARLGRAQVALQAATPGVPAADAVEAGAFALSAGLEDANVQELARICVAPCSAAEALRVAGTLTALGVPAPEAVELVRQTLRSGGKERDLLALPGRVEAELAGGATPAQAAAGLARAAAARAAAHGQSGAPPHGPPTSRRP